MTTCEGRWVGPRYIDTETDEPIVIQHCSGCLERLVTHQGRRIDIPDHANDKMIIEAVIANNRKK